MQEQLRKMAGKVGQKEKHVDRDEMRWGRVDDARVSPELSRDRGLGRRGVIGRG